MGNCYSNTKQDFKPSVYTVKLKSGEDDQIDYNKCQKVISLGMRKRVRLNNQAIIQQSKDNNSDIKEVNIDNNKQNKNKIRLRRQQRLFVYRNRQRSLQNDVQMKENIQENSVFQCIKYYKKDLQEQIYKDQLNQMKNQEDKLSQFVQIQQQQKEKKKEIELFKKKQQGKLEQNYVNCQDLDEQNQQKEDGDIYKCKICLENKANYIGIECGHLSCCENCVLKIKDMCPICRKNQKFKKIFFC